jgi:hypothetical protein
MPRVGFEPTTAVFELVKTMHTFYRAIAQAVSRWLPTSAARVRAQVKSCGICGGQSEAGTGFLRVLRIPLPILIPPTAPYSSSIIWGWYTRPISGRRTKWTVSPHSKTQKKKRKLDGAATVIGLCTDTDIK